jgi:hypothetical protein
VDSCEPPSSPPLPSMGFSSLRSFLILRSARCINCLQTSKNLSLTCRRYRDPPTYQGNDHLPMSKVSISHMSMLIFAEISEKIKMEHVRDAQFDNVERSCEEK